MFIWIIFGVFALIGGLVSKRLKNKFKKYSQIPIASGMSGSEIAQQMLRDNNIYDVKVTMVPGELTDHYHPTHKTVNLSESVYHGKNAASAAVSAHECGHALQHAQAYAPLKMRSTLVPLQNVSAKLINVLVLVGMGGIFMNFLPYHWVILGLCFAYGAIALFALVTLPVEFDASKRALDWIDTNKIVTREELAMSKDALWWAAMTYVVSAIGSMVTFLYYLSIFLSKRRR
ncbi:MAG: Zn-dependent membrane protease YugP [Arenicella sp.]|jgi:Zn-dependent membrane protease YugP